MEPLFWLFFIAGAVTIIVMGFHIEGLKAELMMSKRALEEERRMVGLAVPISSHLSAQAIWPEPELVKIAKLSRRHGKSVAAVTPPPPARPRKK